MRKKKSQVLDGLGGLAIGIATLAITLTVTFLILSQGKEQARLVESSTYASCNSTFSGGNGSCGHGVNATRAMQEAVDDIPGWVPLIVIAIVGGILLSLVAIFRGR